MAQTAVDLESAPVSRVAKKLKCTCGCAQDMTCQMEPGCGICKRAKTKIFAEQQDGKSDSQILNEFVAENGPTILFVTPGLFGTAGPFIALVAGGDRRAAGDPPVHETTRAGFRPGDRSRGPGQNK